MQYSILRSRSRFAAILRSVRRIEVPASKPSRTANFLAIPDISNIVVRTVQALDATHRKMHLHAEYLRSAPRIDPADQRNEHALDPPHHNPCPHRPMPGRGRAGPCRRGTRCRARRRSRTCGIGLCVGQRQDPQRRQQDHHYQWRHPHLRCGHDLPVQPQRGKPLPLPTGSSAPEEVPPESQVQNRYPKHPTPAWAPAPLSDPCPSIRTSARDSSRALKCPRQDSNLRHQL